MSGSTDFSEENWRLGINFFHHVNRWFERDVETVVLGSLSAGIKAVQGQLKRVEGRFDRRLEDATEEEANWIIDDFVDARTDHEDQERFLRNIALVALLSRLTHTLRRLARAAEDFAPHDYTKGAYTGENEFMKLWDEYRKRFGIAVPPKHIQFFDGLRQARNQIVHNGAEANPEKPDHQVTEEMPFRELRDVRFSRKYPQFVHGEGFDAEVRITEIQLDEVAEQAVALTTWLAGELRAKQLQAADRRAAAGSGASS